MKNKTIGEIYHLTKVPEEELDGSYTTEHYNSVIAKTVDNINDEDIAYMLRQEMLPELFIPLAIKRLKENPMAGGLYEGELICSLSMWNPLPVEYKKDIFSILPTLESYLENGFFEFENDKIKYENSLNVIKAQL